MSHFWKSLSDPLYNVIYVQVYKDRFELLDLKTEQTIQCKSEKPFSTNRLLIGQWDVAAQTLKNGMEQLIPSIFYPKPLVLIHPMEMTEGGLSLIEERAFLELAIEVRARKAHVYLGSEMNSQSVRQYLECLAKQ